MHAAIEALFASSPRCSRPVTIDERDEQAWTTATHIVAIAERGDRAAFTLLFARFAPRIKAILIRRGASDAAAEELAQEAMLSVWRRAASFDPRRGNAEAWIFTIARNAAIDARRREHGIALVEFAPDMAPDDPAPIGDALLEAAQASDRLRAAVRVLPADQLEIIRQSFFEDRSHAEIAQALGLPLGTVKSRVRLALKRLRTLVEELK